MLKKAYGEYKICNNPLDLRYAKKIILPGVGSYDNGMINLRQKGWVDEINEAVLNKKIPILGICLGMQLMCNRSEEGQLSGFQWIDADVVRLKSNEALKIKVPHMGWNTVDVKKNNQILSGTKDEQRFYFVHSYHVRCNNSDDIIATTNYGEEIISVFGHDNIYGVQFHPEKSHRFGLNLMKNFAKI